MVLVFDIGNSNVVAGIRDESSWQAVWRYPTYQEQPSLLFYEVKLSEHLLELGLSPGAIRQVVISSVVPELTPVFVALSRQLFELEAVLMRGVLFEKLDLLIERPHEIGSDLVANALAVYHRHRKDCIVVDFGTALTFTPVSARGEILGVSIAPGLKTAIQALYTKTAQLPEVPLVMPESPIGRSTTHAIQSGILIGYVGLVKHMLAEIRGAVGGHYTAIATGGLSAILEPLAGEFEYIDPHLTLEGIYIFGSLFPSELP
ncbi:MAG: type III pantothenate kinase [Saprospiraceae bacterium]|nr:type III pantothenate kinase [Saprospiraceae bacterium]MDP4998503.1 type III pantothenate kinase [Saprospiraceae bacterium]